MGSSDGDNLFRYLPCEGLNINVIVLINLTSKKNGYADHVTTVAISDGEMSELVVHLQRTK